MWARCSAGVKALHSAGIDLTFEAADRLPRDIDFERMSRFVLTVMEGGIMQARGHRDVRRYDDSVAQLRDYFDRLQARSAA